MSALRVRALIATSGVIAVVGACATLGVGSAAAAPTPINGTLSIASGSCANGTATGSFFRMILPAGNTSGPFLSNSDSTCSDKTITLLSPGTDGGLRSGSYQPQPAQAFDAQGNAVAGSVTNPVKFYGVGFATATNPTDPQTGRSTGRPQLYLDGSTISGDLSAFGVTWNKQVFNQGSPKPGGSYPGKTTAVRGQYDASTGTYQLEWTSQIVGGPFNNFTGLWHLTGQLSGAPVAAPTAAAAPTGLAQNGVTQNGVTQNGTAQAGGAQASVAQNGVTQVPAAGAPTPAAAPVAPVIATVPAPHVTVEAQQATGPLTSRWFVVALLLLVAIASALLSNADRLFRRDRTGD
ncbi:MAG: hypothetical protein QM673_06105 [Gordonia sp. (in: high G+C Gram-positive bacteria)]